MRLIDKWVGVPLLFLISPFIWIIDRLRNSKSTKPILRKTLFIELSEMGSAIIADPAMRKLKQEAKAEIFFVIFTKNHKSLEILKTIPSENIFKINGDNFLSLIRDSVRFMAWTRRKKITTVIDLELFSRYTALLSIFSGAKFRVGFSSHYDEGLYRGNSMNCPVRYNPHVHVAMNFISLTNRALGYFDTHYSTVPIEPAELKLARSKVSMESLSNVDRKLNELYPGRKEEIIIIVNPNASDMLPQRRWQQENFAAVSKQLLQRFENLLIVVTGSPDERGYVQQVVDMANHARCINSAGYFSFEELIPLYWISACMLTNDSGPAHFAAATPLKTFILFGPETPDLYLPLGNSEPIYLGLPCSPCVSAANHRKTGCKPRPCITTISPGLVFGRMNEFLLQKGLVNQPPTPSRLRELISYQ